MSACRKSCSAPGVSEMSPRQVDRRPAGGGRGGRGWRGWNAREGARHRKGGESAGTRWWGLGAWKRKVRFSGTVRAIIIQKVIKYQNRLLYFHPIIIYVYKYIYIYIYINTIVICEVFSFIMSGLELTCISSVETLSTWQELEITFGTGGLALPKFGGEKKPATSATSWKPPNATTTVLGDSCH